MFLNDFVDMIMLKIKWWGLCIVIGVVVILLVVLIKCCFVLKKFILEILCFLRLVCLGLKRWKKFKYGSDDEVEGVSKRVVESVKSDWLNNRGVDSSDSNVISI